MLGHRRASLNLDSVLERLAENRDELDGVVVTGGEPTIDLGLRETLRGLVAIGLPVRLDTNGSSPDVLETLIAEDLVSFVALDVKSTPDRYDSATSCRSIWPRVQESIALLIRSGVDHEFRTTCYPSALRTADLPGIARQLEGGNRFVIQQFRPQRTLDPAAAGVRPYEADALRRAALCCAMHLPTVVRGV
jgi:pyruvate formate lyase activating enzyme